MTDTSSPSPDNAGYFDEAYFERGWERGTAYANYSASAASSAIFSGLAQALQQVFKPRLALEIGCATGSIVNNLNMLGVAAHGIDVSDWAVRNALHHNVRKASAADLPFPDGSFDLVYSSHAMEHLPLDIYAAAFREIDRVCGANAIQFHMLPIIGTYPYDYDEATAIQNLKADPTHVLLQRMEWWLERWAELGWEPVPGALFLPNDTDNVELSSGQFCLVRKSSGMVAAVSGAMNDWNAKAFREVVLQRQANAAGQAGDVVSVAANKPQLPLPLGPSADEWNDFRKDLYSAHDLENARFHGIASLESDKTVSLRIALISQSGGVHERWLEIPPGYSVISVDVSQFRILSGDGNLKDIRSILFGGVIGKFSIAANFAVLGPAVSLDGIFT
jgi:SAM-dependent methyltransferase